ncbi:single-stranded DNA-binding protein [Patescibacteria group bacterium]|nr:single-stranded DNA-binding protein [Patescibacteria group bacterium]MBU1755126.1 single-stranded DNA-binding protein [Patescibacteria group bacterium]
MYLNKALLYGNLTRDPEVRALPSGQQVATFAIATNRSFRNKEGQQQEQVEYHNVVAFGRQAEVIGQYLKKGRPIFVEGRIQTRSWDSEGQKKYRTEIVIDNFQFGPQAGGAAPTGGAPRAASAAPESNDAGPMQDTGADSIQYPDEEINPEDIPF